MAVQLQLQQLPEPLLEFGGVGEFTDPKTGLRDAGPYDLRFGKARNGNIKIGLVGPAAMLVKAKAWFTRCQGFIQSTMTNLAQYPHYPGFEATFRATLTCSKHWESVLDDDALAQALGSKTPAATFEAVLNLYEAGIRRLATLEVSRPDIVVCCLPEEVTEKCWSIENKVSKDVRAKAAKLTGQLNLFEPIVEVEQNTSDLLRRDFRRALKARAMRHHMPIQLGSDRLFIDTPKGQDAATRAWHSTIAIYYKAGGVPWRLRSEGPETCFVGISFHHLYTTQDKHLVRSCIAQAFSSDGEGFALRGANIPWDEKQDRQVHLTQQQAGELGEKVLEHYQERTGSTPLRVVVHKTSQFDEAESEGLRTALANVPIVELVNIAPTDFRLLRLGDYPPRRGTLCTVNEQRYYLFTTGFITALKTYPGPHIPAPLQLLSDMPLDLARVAADILGLTRMNWNSASITSGYPVTLNFARKVGGIMAEYGESEPLTSFRYYI